MTIFKTILRIILILPALIAYSWFAVFAIISFNSKMIIGIDEFIIDWFNN